MNLSTDPRAGTFASQAFQAGMRFHLHGGLVSHAAQDELEAEAVQFRSGLTLNGQQLSDSILMGRCVLWYMMGITYSQGQKDLNTYGLAARSAGFGSTAPRLSRDY